MAILIVDDEPLIRMCAVEMVEELGFETVEAANADDAIAILERRCDIGIVFTDINMAGSMDGLQLAAFVRDRWPPIQFIVVSGEQKPNLADLPESSYFFAKPYDTKQICSALATFAG
ncbi:MAG: response regulator [Pseudomonas sp.]|uniref:response regulator n=1 Tax=Pseudomonas sp. TaxID=306 RepID=UPI001204A491|nr:response regulator [Pseudomonas sp.]RZI70360.1 MAG: response regulator [Pseudomonas sp.]